eukprot:TRINITY_DN58602_c0_g1_i1.p1 TRINITY_DN58602_c0_g1~~TRINITY_DN58602_c0_g1_i1.p1  ORF type:complete len:439 (+),score=61.38 TRINITY_DN58602_c0_g1_i1:54-1319(+)
MAADASFAPLNQSAEATSDDSSESDSGIGLVPSRSARALRSSRVAWLASRGLAAAAVLGIVGVLFSSQPSSLGEIASDARTALGNTARDMEPGSIEADGLDLTHEGAPMISEADDMAAAKQYAAVSAQSKGEYKPHNPELALPSEAPLQTFYVYRAQSPHNPDGDYPLSNVNVASLGGVMWYLHDEVILNCPRNGQRKFGITRIRRLKITTRATTPLWNKGMNFGLKCSFDSGECTGPHADHVEGRGTGWHAMHDYNKYGFYVGCNNLGEWPHSEMVFQRARKYPNAIWYSLPGPCPTMNFHRATEDCNANLPGGLCDHPDGRGNCTYSIEEAGEIDIDELVGITPKWKDRGEFCRSGGYEGRGSTQWNGRKLDFWNNIWDANKNHERTRKAEELFRQKYPNMPDLPPPKCDVSARKFYSK